MRIENYFVFMVFMLGTITAQLNNGCFTPNYGEGNCIDYMRCDKILQIAQSSGVSVIPVVKKLFCGYEGEVPKVCCPFHITQPTTQKIYQSNRPKPQSTTQKIYQSNRPKPQSTTQKIYQSNQQKPQSTTQKIYQSNKQKPQSTTQKMYQSNHQKPQSTTQKIYQSNCNKCVPSILPSRSTCGISNRIVNRIIGGSPSLLGAWPWMVALGYQSSNKKNAFINWRCSGTLITSKHVISAAHCIVNRNSLRPTIARLGDLNLDLHVNDWATPLDIPIERIITHSEYFEGNKHINDIALLKLKQSVAFTDFIQPICLPFLTDMQIINLQQSTPYIAGWGITYESTDGYNSEQSDSLMEAQVPIVNNAKCKQAYSYLDTALIDERVICAGLSNGGKDSCRGDSGGPLMVQKGTQFYLIGIISYGHEICGVSGFPGVYTRVSSFIEWIIEKTSKK